MPPFAPRKNKVKPMTGHHTIDELKEIASDRGKDPRTRKALTIVLVLWLLTLLAFAGVTWNAYFSEKEKSQTLAQQIAFACESGNFGPDISPQYQKALCDNAKAVIAQQGEIQEGEIQEPEIQDSETQDPEYQQDEIQDKEIQNPEDQNSERQDSESQEDEEQEPEIQDEETQDPEIQEPENQDPEIDDPDPNDDIREGSCSFDGYGTIEFTFETTSGPVTFSCTGTMTPPGQE